MKFDLSTYIDVQERINRFWSEFPGGSIVTRLMSPPDDFTQCRYEASVYQDQAEIRPAAVGHAFELAGGAGPNATSHEENCETSAIGRALANMGYAKTRDDRPSQQEMTKAARGVARTDTPAVHATSAQNVRPGAPERVTAASQAAVTDAATAIDLGGLHKDGDAKGLGHDELHDLAAALMGVGSLKALTPRQLFELRQFITRSTPPEIQARLDAVRAGARLPGMPEPAGVAGSDQWTA